MKPISAGYYRMMRLARLLSISHDHYRHHQHSAIENAPESMCARKHRDNCVLSHGQDTYIVDKLHQSFKGITDIISIAQFYNNNLPLPSYFQPRAQQLT